MTPFWRWRFPSGTYGNVAWRFRTRKECEKHYRGFDGEAALMEEREVKKKVVRTVWIMRDNYDYLICASQDDDADITIPVDRFENMFRVRLGNGNAPVEFRLERVVRKRGKFAKRKAMKP